MRPAIFAVDGTFQDCSGKSSYWYVREVVESIFLWPWLRTIVTEAGEGLRPVYQLRAY